MGESDAELGRMPKHAEVVNINRWEGIAPDGLGSTIRR